MRRLLQGAVALSSIVIFCLALWAIYRVLDEYSIHDIAESLRQIPLFSIILAGAFTAISYAVLAGSDILAARYAVAWCLRPLCV